MSVTVYKGKKHQHRQLEVLMKIDSHQDATCYIEAISFLLSQIEDEAFIQHGITHVNTQIYWATDLIRFLQQVEWEYYALIARSEKKRRRKK